mgnify:FL=1
MQKWVEKHWWIALFYIAIISAVSLLKWLNVSLDQTTLIVIAIVLLPFIVQRLTEIEAGGVRVTLRELKNEVTETKQTVTQEVAAVREDYRQLSDHLTRAVEKASTYLKPQPLLISDHLAAEMRNTVNLTSVEVEQGLSSIDPNMRVPAYIELQVRPISQLSDQLIDCFLLEQWLARKQKETRPLWQLLVAVEKLITSSQVFDSDRVLFALNQTLHFLQSDDSIDPGKQCEKRIRHMLVILGDQKKP